MLEAGNVEACAAAIKHFWGCFDYDEMCMIAKREAEAKYYEEVNPGQLMKECGNVVVERI